MCKPCIPDNITIVDSDDWTDMSKLKRLRIYTDKTDKFDKKEYFALPLRSREAAGGTPDRIGGPYLICKDEIRMIIRHG